MTREIQVDSDLCQGSGQCVIYAPSTFGQDELTVAVVLDVHGDPDDAICRAIERCPTHALTLIESPVEVRRSSEVGGSPE